MPEDLSRRLSGKEFRKLLRVRTQQFARSKKEQRLLREAPLIDLFDVAFLARAGLERTQTQLFGLGQSLSFALQSLGLRSVGDIERISLDILAHVPGIGMQSLALLKDLATALGLTLSNTPFEESAIPRPQGKALADALRLPR